MRIENRNEDFPIIQEAEIKPQASGGRPLLESLKSSVKGVAEKVAWAMARFGERHNKTIERAAKVGLFLMIPAAGAWYIYQGGDLLKTFLYAGGAELITYCAMKVAEAYEPQQAENSQELFIPHG